MSAGITCGKSPPGCDWCLACVQDELEATDRILAMFRGQGTCHICKAAWGANCDDAVHDEHESIYLRPKAPRA